MKRIAACALLVGAFALRVVGLDWQELRGDETFGYFFSLVSPWEMVQRTLELGEPHPVASYWLMHGWMTVAGESEFALRFIGAGWNLLAVVLLGALARRLNLGERSAFLGMALAALSPYLIWHAQDARMYSMSLALTVVSTLLLVTWQRQPRLVTACAYVGITWMALHTHYYGVYVVAAHGLIVLLPIFRRRHGLMGVWLPGIAGLAFVPWVWAVRHVLTGYHGNGDSPGLGAALARAANAMVMGETSPPELRWAIAAAVGAVVVLGTWRLYRCSPGAVQVLGLYAALPLLAIWLGATMRPVFDERYLAVIAPPIYLLMAAAVGMEHGGLRRVGLALVVLGVALMAVGFVRYSTDPAFSKTRGWRELAAELNLFASGAPTATVRLMQNYPDPTLWYYYRGPVAHGVLPPRGNDLAAAHGEVRSLVQAGVTRVLFVAQPSPQWDGDEIGHLALRGEYTPIELGRLHGWELWAYLRPDPQLSESPVAYAQELRLVGTALSGNTVRPGGVAAVTLGWERGASTPERLAVSVQMLASDGSLIAQNDRPLPRADRQEDVYGILVPRTLATGEYRLVVAVYPAQEANAPRLRTLAGHDVVEIGRVRVSTEIFP